MTAQKYIIVLLILCVLISITALVLSIILIGDVNSNSDMIKELQESNSENESSLRKLETANARNESSITELESLIIEHESSMDTTFGPRIN